MQKIIFLMLLLFAATAVKAQGISGFFTQSETKLKYMEQQIAAYEVYIRYLKDGYSTMQKGTTAVHDLKNGTFQLHQDYFATLKSVNPSVANSPKIKTIMAWQQSIEREFDKAINDQANAGQLTADEMGYVKNVYKNLLSECDKDLDELTAVVSPGKLQMKDDERLKRIDILYDDMQDKYVFTESFIKNTTLLSLQRRQGKNDLDAANTLYGLK